jgi:hypothetical protein
MDKRAPSRPGSGKAGRQRLVADLASIRGMGQREASSWCEAWEQHAAQTGLPSGDAYFWDSARGWIDAQLLVAPTEIKRQAKRRLEGVAAARRRATPGSRKHKTLLAEEDRLVSRLKTLTGGDVVASRGATTGGRGA